MHLKVQDRGESESRQAVENLGKTTPGTRRGILKKNSRIPTKKKGALGPASQELTTTGSKMKIGGERKAKRSQMRRAKQD